MVERRWTALGAAVVAALALLTVAPTAAAAEPTLLPVPYGDRALAVGANPLDVSPPGANRWDCRPSDRHPNPVVLAHGAGANQWINWQTISPLLANEGYCVFALTYGRNPLVPPSLEPFGGLAPMEDSARELGRFVDRIRAATGADKVDIVGHSEGSLMPNYYVKFLGGSRYVQRYVGMTPLWDGTTLHGVGPLFFGDSTVLGQSKLAPAAVAPFCASCKQFFRGSRFLEKMNSDGGPAVDGVTYTMIMTRYEEAVVPYTSGIMHDDDATNIVLQDGCPNDLAEHGAVAVDPVTAQHILNALDPAHARPVDCYAADARRT